MPAEKRRKKERKGRKRFKEYQDTEKKVAFRLLNIEVHWIWKIIDMQWVSMPRWLGASLSKTRIRVQCQDKSCSGAEEMPLFDSVSACQEMSPYVKRIQLHCCSAAVPYGHISSTFPLIRLQGKQLQLDMSGVVNHVDKQKTDNRVLSRQFGWWEIHLKMRISFD